MPEIWEVRLGDDSRNIGKTIKELGFPTNSAVFAILNDDELIFKFAEHKLRAEDKLIIYVGATDIRRIEDIFYR